MNTISNVTKLALAAVAMMLMGAASANESRHGNYVGTVSPVGNVRYDSQQVHHHHNHRRSRDDWAPFAVGVITGVVIQEIRRKPEIVYVPEPVVVHAPPPSPTRWVYVNSDPRLECAGGTWINGGYFCPRRVQ